MICKLCYSPVAGMLLVAMELVISPLSSWLFDKLASQRLMEERVHRLPAVSSFQDAILAIFFTAIAGVVNSLFRGRKQSGLGMGWRTDSSSTSSVESPYASQLLIDVKL